MEDLKKKYNATLKRFKNGCKYLSKNPNEVDKYIPELIKIVKDLGIMIDMFAQLYLYVMTDNEIERGFKITNEK